MEKHSPGQSLLALVILIGAMIGIVAALLAFFTSSFVDSGYGYQASVTAEAAATSGAEDGLLQLNRNPSFPNATYFLPVGSTTVTVSVTQNAPSINLITVSSTATVSLRTRKISVVVSKNASTTQISVVSWQEF